MVHHNNILIVDDEINVCRGCQRIFDEEGYTSDYALTGKEGLEKAYTEDFDVIVTDMKIPDISGIDITRKIKEKKPDTPIIMITGYASVPTAVEAMKLGADDYIPKPFLPDEILNAVKDAMKRTKGRFIMKKNGSKKERIIDKQQVLDVLNRTAIDNEFWKDLMTNGSKALEGYNLTSEAKAAILSGDISWIEENIGKLTDAQMEYLSHRLETERW